MADHTTLRNFLLDLTTQTWRDDAACIGFPFAIFFPERGETTRPAKEICATCTVRWECLEYAFVFREKHGIWGGTSGRDRRRIRRAGGLRELPKINFEEEDDLADDELEAAS